MPPLVTPKHLRMTKRKGETYHLYYVDYHGMWQIIQGWNKAEIKRVIMALYKLRNNLILK